MVGNQSLISRIAPGVSPFHPLLSRAASQAFALCAGATVSRGKLACVLPAKRASHRTCRPKLPFRSPASEDVIRNGSHQLKVQGGTEFSFIVPIRPMTIRRAKPQSHFGCLFILKPTCHERPFPHELFYHSFFPPSPESTFLISDSPVDCAWRRGVRLDIPRIGSGGHGSGGR